MTLRFEGILSPWVGLLLAFAVATVAAFLYWREVRANSQRSTRLLPFIRAAAVFLVLLMLTGPLIHWSRTEQVHGRVLVMVDASKSMGTTDDQMAPAPKARLMKAMGLAKNPPLDDERALRRYLTGNTGKAAVAKFDATARWQRAESILFGSTDLAQKLADGGKSTVEIYALAGKETPLISSDGNRALPYRPEADATDLAAGLRARADDANADAPIIAVVLLSDGQHNQGASPLQAAQSLGHRRVPLYTIGFGASNAPPDLAVTGLDAPDAVHVDDRVRGRVVFQDGMPAGKPFTLRIETQAPPGASGQPRLLFESKLNTRGDGARRADFDFPMGLAAQQQIDALTSNDMEVMSLPVALRVTLTPVQGERNTANNTAELMVRAVRGRRKVLIVDGRPRWEFRYLRNLFERDRKWDTNALVSGIDPGGRPWPRGATLGTFPKDRDTLFTYDLIMLGDLPPALLRPEEIDWLRGFVADRGGGLVLIDGPRGNLRLFAGTPLGPLWPVQATAANAGAGPWVLRATQRGAALGALDLGAGEEQWRDMKAPRWLAGVEALPGAETLLEAAAGQLVTPAVVTRRFGAGKVWYQAFDESWRWRYDVADTYHRRYWNQVADAVMETPYAVRDKFVSLDVGSPSYDAGANAEIRALVRDAAGKPVAKPDAVATLLRDGAKVASIPLTPDENGGGRLRARTDALAPGRYDVSVSVKGVAPDQMKARVSFNVRGAAAGELANLTLNSALLNGMADAAGGKYFNEENAADVAGEIASLARTRTIESSYALWHNWPWFVPIVLLLSLEWILRKRAGMV